MKGLSFKDINWKRVFVIVGIALVLMLLSAAGYWYWLSAKASKNNSSSNTATTKSTSSAQPANTTSTTPTTSTTVTGTSGTNKSTSGTSGSSGGSGNSGSGNANTPPVAFAVTSATAEADRTFVCSNVDTIVNFTGRITANAAGTVHYHWERSDGGSTSDQTIAFTTAGTQQVATSWTLFGLQVDLPWYLRPFVQKAYAVTQGVTMWEKLVVTSPNNVSSNQASFSYYSCIN